MDFYLTENNQTINMSATKPIKVKSVIFFLKNKLNSNSKIIFNKKKSNHFIISTKKIENVLGFKPSSTKIILQRYVENFINS